MNDDISIVVNIDNRSKKTYIYANDLKVFEFDNVYFTKIVHALIKNDINFFLNIKKNFDSVTKNYDSITNTLELYFDKYVNDYIVTLRILITYTKTRSKDNKIEIAYELYDRNDYLIFSVTNTHNIRNVTFKKKILKELYETL